MYYVCGVQHNTRAARDNHITLSPFKALLCRVETDIYIMCQIPLFTVLLYHLIVVVLLRPKYDGVGSTWLSGRMIPPDYKIFTS